MSNQNNIINMIYRAPSGFHSIENVFDLIYKELSAELKIKQTYLPCNKLQLRSILLNIAAARKSQTAVNHITGDAHYSILGLDNCKYNILTVHDLVTLEYLSGLKRNIAKRLWFTLPVKKAKHVTVISKATARRLVDICPEAGDKIEVIHNPVSPIFTYKPKPINRIKPTILHVGTTPNKNLERVIEALEGLAIDLVVVGKMTDNQKEALFKNQINFKNIYDLTNEQIVKQYQECDIVLFPSLYEGFGLPIIEANAIGRPIITSKIEPMIEVAGDAAYFVNPRSKREIREAVEVLIENTDLRDTLVDNGLKNHRRFRLSDIACKYMKLYVPYLESVG